MSEILDKLKALQEAYETAPHSVSFKVYAHALCAAIFSSVGDVVIDTESRRFVNANRVANQINLVSVGHRAEEAITIPLTPDEALTLAFALIQVALKGGAGNEI